MTRPGPADRRALVAAVFLLLTAAAALGGSAAAGWARVWFQVPLRGGVAVRVDGSDLWPALGPLALLVLTVVAVVLATGGWVRRLLGVLLLGTALVPALGVVRWTQQRELLGAATAAGELPARSVPDGTVTLLPGGPVLAVIGTVLIAGAGVLLLRRGHRMPRMGRRYRARAGLEPTRSGPTVGMPPSSGSSGSVPTPSVPPASHEWWERIDAGEDPTALGDPR
ncbi:MAG: Trp biosynthesis-associated membrane protein [Pseudonocardiaceae bacterium]